MRKQKLVWVYVAAAHELLLDFPHREIGAFDPAFTEPLNLFTNVVNDGHD